jgi:hypothetical protein
VRDTQRLAALLGVLGLAVVATVACGGDGATEFPPTSTATASLTAQATSAPASPTVVGSMTTEERSQAEGLLKAATLGAADLPEGFTLVDEGFTTNEEVAGEEGSSPGALGVEDLDRLGRILGYEAVYSREASSGTLLLLVTTDLFRDSAGAGEHFDLLRQQPSDPELLKALQESLPDASLDIQNATISPISFAEVGDDRLAYELKATVHIPDLNTNVVQFTRFVDIQRGRGIGSLAAVAVGSPSPVEELEDLARKLDERMKDALE